MRIDSVRIENLRSFRDQTVPFRDHTAIVGPNGAGKSTVLLALNIFFRESEGHSADLARLSMEDFHRKNTGDPIRITVTFGDLSPEAEEDFADYCRQGKLVVSSVASFDAGSQTAEVRQYGQRLGIEEFRPYFEMLDANARVSDLKTTYEGIRAAHPDLPAPSTKDNMTAALRDYEAARAALCTLIPSEDQFYGWSKGANRLGKYVQWVYVPAVKDVVSEQVEGRNTALGKLLARTVRTRLALTEHIELLREETRKRYQGLLEENQHVLEELSAGLRSRLSDWSHPDAAVRLEWQQDPEKSVRVEEPLAHIIAGEGAFEGELSRFGHGFQRSYLLALLQELSGSDDRSGPRLVLAIEEPELYQHPPQMRHLHDVLVRLSQSNAQVVFCTHNPAFVAGDRFEDVRLVRKEDAQSVVSYVSYDDIAGRVAAALGEAPSQPSGVMAKVHQVMQTSVSEMFFTPRLVLVEGLEDAAYVATYLTLLEKWSEFRRRGGHIVAPGGKSALIQPLAIAKEMRIPVYVVFDSDGDKPDKNGSRAKHEKDNRALLKLCGSSLTDPFPPDSHWSNGMTMWSSDIGAIVKADIGAAEWSSYCQEADCYYGHVGDLRKNSLHIGRALTQAWEDGKRSANLVTLCERILQFLGEN